ncbi:hypothetical protein [Aureimonas sp. AU4]|uniref:hypothetical protein n=1 Tax=Aureimonas sp. AU4 TaxID=1638163 RepID=UPI0007856B7B|nr:hypothetical protein [Aureimonas sp. AU4]
MPLPATTIRCISGHWHLVVTTDGSERTHPAASKLEAEIMAVRERRRLAEVRLAEAAGGAEFDK